MFTHPPLPVGRLLVRCGRGVGDPELLGGRGASEMADTVSELDPRPRPRPERGPELEGLV
jgi:hypothetical protein